MKSKKARIGKFAINAKNATNADNAEKKTKDRLQFQKFRERKKLE